MSKIECVDLIIASCMAQGDTRRQALESMARSRKSLDVDTLAIVGALLAEDRQRDHVSLNADRELARSYREAIEAGARSARASFKAEVAQPLRAARYQIPVVQHVPEPTLHWGWIVFGLILGACIAFAKQL